MLEKIISGGQSGVDRAALDAALSRHLPVGGWCPAGRRAEDGAIPLDYPLTETRSSGYSLRTEWNVRDADATLVIKRGPLAGGTLLTTRLAESLQRPYLVVDLDHATAADEAVAWLRENAVRVLNVAGPRESQRPGIYRRARRLLDRVLERVAPGADR